MTLHSQVTQIFLAQAVNTCMHLHAMAVTMQEGRAECMSYSHE